MTFVNAEIFQNPNAIPNSNDYTSPINKIEDPITQENVSVYNTNLTDFDGNSKKEFSSFIIPVIVIILIIFIVIYLKQKKNKKKIQGKEKPNKKDDPIDYQKISEDIESIKEPSEEIEKDVEEVEDNKIEKNEFPNHLVINEVEEKETGSEETKDNTEEEKENPDKENAEVKNDKNLEEGLGEEK